MYVKDNKGGRKIKQAVWLLKQFHATFARVHNKGGGDMDRYIPWLFVGGEGIFYPSMPRLMAAGWIATIILVIVLASLGYIVYD